jgi:Cft2 family RNA processing exonuclease
VAGRLPRCPIYVSGLGIDLLNGFEQIAQAGGTLRVRKSHLSDLKAEKLPGRHRAGKHGPAIYLLSSGMMVENTPSYLAAASLLDDPRSLIAFSGYSDPDTPGGKLQTASAQGASHFLFNALGKRVTMRANIRKFDLSSHADRDQLVAMALSHQPRTIVLTHGDADARQWFLQQFAERAPQCKVIDPVPLTATPV